MGISQDHREAFPAGAVNRMHQLECTVSFGSRDQRRAALRNGFCEVAELALERSERDRHGIGSAGRRRRGAWGLFAGVRLDFPGRQLIASDDGEAPGSVNFDPFRTAWTE